MMWKLKAFTQGFIQGYTARQQWDMVSIVECLIGLLILIPLAGFAMSWQHPMVYILFGMAIVGTLALLSVLLKVGD